MKTCNKCKIEKDELEFYFCKTRNSYRSICKACYKKDYKSYYDSTPELQKLKSKKYRTSKNFKEKYNIRKKRYQQTYKGIYWTYKGNAKHSNLDFKLTMNDFKNFEGKNCFYCGDKLIRIGLDRINNLKGYTLNNVNPCCSICNYMRRIQTQKDFINKCRQISERFSNVI